MKFEVITLFEDHFTGFCKTGVVGQAINNGKISVNFTNPRTFTSDVHQTVDDRPFGGGDGMLMKPEPLSKALDQSIEKSPQAKRVYLSPQGKKWNHELAKSWAQSNQDLILVSGRYGGIDQRVIHKYELEEISIGDYVLSGGELAAMVMIDSMARFVPSVLGNQSSAHEDSFSEDQLLECPQFTRPREHAGISVPGFLLSGDHKKIETLKRQISLILTYQKRPDLVQNEQEIESTYEELKRVLSVEELQLLRVQLD